MNQQNVAIESAVAGVLEALAHPLRIRILKALLEHRYCQCELASKFGEHPVNISRHLAVLARAGLVRITKEGNKTFPRLLMPQIGGVLKTAEAIVRRTAAQRVKEARSLRSALS